jgi:hypothetical protein
MGLNMAKKYSELRARMSRKAREQSEAMSTKLLLIGRRPPKLAVSKTETVDVEPVKNARVIRRFTKNDV